MEQSINLKSVGNARELGGYKAGESAIKHGLLLRTGALYSLSEQDKSTLADSYKVAKIVDFRMSVEREKSPDPELMDAENIFLPVLEFEDYPDCDVELVKKSLTPGQDRTDLMKRSFEMGLLSDSLYVDFLFMERGKKAYRDLFDCLLALPVGRAILWHCTDGKDRTGVASMLILTALGASKETIMQDYLLTNEYNREQLDRVRAGLERADMTPKMKQLMLFGAGAVYENYMLNAIEAMSSRCGSPEGYLAQELGVGEAEINELRQKFLE